MLSIAPAVRAPAKLRYSCRVDSVSNSVSGLEYVLYLSCTVCVTITCWGAKGKHQKMHLVSLILTFPTLCAIKLSHPPPWCRSSLKLHLHWNHPLNYLAMRILGFISLLQPTTRQLLSKLHYCLDELLVVLCRAEQSKMSLFFVYPSSGKHIHDSLFELFYLSEQKSKKYIQCSSTCFIKKQII